MSALMPETNRKNCVDPTVFPMRRQNTSNQTPANASTSAAQLTAGPGPYTACPGPLCQTANNKRNESRITRIGDLYHQIKCKELDHCE